MATDEQTPDKEPAPAPAPRKRRVLWIGLTVVVLLLGGGGGAWYWMKTQAATGEAQAEPEHQEPLHQALIPFDSFVVNLADAAITVGGCLLAIRLLFTDAALEPVPVAERD